MQTIYSILTPDWIYRTISSRVHYGLDPIEVANYYPNLCNTIQYNLNNESIDYRLLSVLLLQYIQGTYKLEFKGMFAYTKEMSFLKSLQDKSK